MQGAKIIAMTGRSASKKSEPINGIVQCNRMAPKRSHVYFHGVEGCNGIQCNVESTELKEIQAADHLLYDLAGRAKSCF